MSPLFQFTICTSRLSGGSEKHSLRKDAGGGGFGRTRFVKSPEQLEATFSMTTIEEEQESLSIALSLRNLNQIDDSTSLKSLNDENPED